MINYSNLYEKLGYRFKDEALLTLALTHSSRSKEINYERLEFLGDRILGFEVASLLYREFPKEPEGILARRLVNLVRQETLAKIAIEMGLPDFILLSKGEENSGGNYKESVLADCCESVLAAIYTDGGIGPVNDLTERYWRPLLNQEFAADKDAKSQLQEFIQSLGKPLPQYVVVEETGVKHKPTFVVEVLCEGYPPVRGVGTSKRLATQQAAENMLLELEKENRNK